MLLTFFVILTIALTTAVIASGKGRSGVGWFVLGVLFSGLTFIAVLIVPTRKTRCPNCKESIFKEAKVCKHCGRKMVSTNISMNKEEKAAIEENQKIAIAEQTR